MSFSLLSPLRRSNSFSFSPPSKMAKRGLFSLFQSSRCLLSSHHPSYPSPLSSSSLQSSQCRWKTTQGDKILYLVPTPIGNEDDLTLRAASLLPRVDVVACEDTRITLRLLRQHNIRTNVQRLDQNTIFQPRADNLFNRYNEIAFMTDAGTPGISDPGGNEIHELAQRHGFKVIALPGACSVTTALSASGLPIERFAFEGFLPKSGRQRDARIQEISFEQRTVVIFESPRRVEKTLRDLMGRCGGEREVVVMREITKKFEERIGGRVGEVLEEIEKRGGIRGEVVIVVGPAGYQSLDREGGGGRGEEGKGELGGRGGRGSEKEEPVEAMGATESATGTLSGSPTPSKEELVWFQRFYEKGLRGKQLVMALTAVGFRKQQAYDLVHKVMKKEDEEK